MENGKKTVYKSPGRGGPHLSGDVQSPNVSKLMGFGRIFIRENRTSQIEEFRGPQMGSKVQGSLEPPSGKRKKNGLENGKKTVWPGRKTEKKCFCGKRKKNVPSIFHNH